MVLWECIPIHNEIMVTSRSIGDFSKEEEEEEKEKVGST